jgi:hypothetical protein
MTLLESKALDGIGGGGFEHLKLSPGERMKVPKGCVGVQSEAGEYTIIRPGSGAQLESQTVFRDERNLIVGLPESLCVLRSLLYQLVCSNISLDLHSLFRN